MMLRVKPPLPYDQQLNRFKERGLIVGDDSEAIEILKRVSYYRLTAYALTFKNNDIFTPGTTFETIYRHYEFDSKLRNILMEIIEHVEIAFRTHIAHEIAHNFGPLGYQNPSHFRNLINHETFINELTKSIDKSKDPFIEWHRTRYQGQFPSWVAFEVLTFSSISMLFKNLLLDNQKSIAKTFYRGLDYTLISNWLHLLSVVRNRCAHYSRLFNQSLNLDIKFRSIDRNLDITNRTLFAVIFNLKYLIKDRTWITWVTKLETLIAEYREVDIRLLGFNEDWHRLLEKK
ncbi:Abi family protein [Cohnella lubricantis]|uniref:Abi family protein n=2 Tax=Cohnella lubricantis TaxID=2163172 RepID=A0A841TB06_9BACL|nr:Abi family protein [Cohnella lubricantis]MBP2117234.1 abortive infection bacteriophage resistance protein [Cohnella lubricantis]